VFCRRGTSNQDSNGFRPPGGSSRGSYVSGVQRGVVHDGLSGVGGGKVPASQGSCGVATGQSWHPGESGPSGIEDAVRTEVASVVDISKED
jgi:hypothetical protein